MNDEYLTVKPVSSSIEDIVVSADKFNTSAISRSFEWDWNPLEQGWALFFSDGHLNFIFWSEGRQHFFEVTSSQKTYLKKNIYRPTVINLNLT